MSSRSDYDIWSRTTTSPRNDAHNPLSLSALPDFAFRRVLVKGKFEEPPLFLGPAVEQGIPGWNLILPFSRASSGGSTILVNRGFITNTKVKAIKDGIDPPSGIAKDGSSDEVVIEGMLTKNFDGGSKGRWTPENVPESNQWFWKDLMAMAQWCSTDTRKVQPVFVDAIESAFSSGFHRPACAIIADPTQMGLCHLPT